MRPVSLSDESLDPLDLDEFQEFQTSDSPHGRRTKYEEEDESIFDEEDDDDELEDIGDVFDMMSEGLFYDE